MALENVQYWKTIHTITEKLSRRFVPFHYHLIRCMQSRRCGHSYHFELSRKAAQEYLSLVKGDFVDFEEEICKLPSPVSSTKVARTLKRIPLCYDPLMCALAPDSPDMMFEVCFEDAVELSEKVGNMLFDAIRMADRILQKHFDKRTTGDNIQP